MADRPWVISFVVLCAGIVLGLVPFPVAFSAVAAESSQQTTVVTPSAASQQVEITADRIEYFQITDVYEAEGSVVIVQGPMRLTSDHATLFALSGTLIAEGHVHLKDRVSDVDAERLELNVNTEAGVLTHGQLYINLTNTLFTGRIMQRFSEDHYRAKEGAFTNCDARKGEVPAWRLTFKDADLMAGDRVYLKNAWLCVNDIPLVPFPEFSYPVATARKSGLLVPTPGYDNRFGWTYRQSVFWAISPSQDLTVSPQYWKDLGYGSDFEYRYALDRKSKGQWLLSVLKQEHLPKVEGVDQNSGDVKRTRALISGLHTQQVNPNLRVTSSVFLVSDPEYLSQLSNSGAQRAMPGGDNNLLVNQRLANGNLYLLGQYLQPLNAGGNTTFQRVPELGHGFANYAPFGGPVLLGMDSRATHFNRLEGFQMSRADLLPSLSTEQWQIGHVVGFTPQVKLRETYYTHSVATSKSTHRETLWASLEAASSLARRFDRDGGRSVLHTIEPKVVYEYVPPTDQSKIVQIDDVDNLTKKNLVTYSLQSRLLGQNEKGMTRSWLDLTLAQSYRPGSVQTEARQFVFPGSPQFDSNTQPLQPAMTSVTGKKFSDLWMRAVIGDPALPPVTIPGQQLQRSILPAINNTLTMDAFFDPYGGGLSQWNTDLRFQQENKWYVEIGQRYTREGNRVQRGDIWNPISFNGVFTPTPELIFSTVTGAVRLPFGWTVGAKAYYDFKNKQSPELDVVGLYQNPCKCWAAGLYFLQFPDRQQYNFMISLTGIGWTENFGTAVLKSILSPLLIGERGLPWAAPGGQYGRLPPPASATTGGPARP